MHRGLYISARSLLWKYYSNKYSEKAPGEINSDLEANTVRSMQSAKRHALEKV